MHKVRQHPPAFGGEISSLISLPFFVGQVAWICFFIHILILHNRTKTFPDRL